MASIPDMLRYIISRVRHFEHGQPWRFFEIAIFSDAACHGLYVEILRALICTMMPIIHWRFNPRKAGQVVTMNTLVSRLRRFEHGQPWRLV